MAGASASERHRHTISAASVSTHENHEGRFMMIRFPRMRHSARIDWPGVRPACNDRRRLDMKWETPQAIDFRFGMEITMYIAHR
jgi:coenzyme PQQ precursor peptide PqqA